MMVDHELELIGVSWLQPRGNLEYGVYVRIHDMGMPSIDACQMLDNVSIDGDDIVCNSAGTLNASCTSIMAMSVLYIILTCVNSLLYKQHSSC